MLSFIEHTMVLVWITAVVISHYVALKVAKRFVDWRLDRLVFMKIV